MGLNNIARFIKRTDVILAFSFSLIFFILYWYTLVPTIYSGDSGEITTAIYELGVPHSTGFPLYMLLAKGFSYLVFFAPSFAYATNLFSAFCGAVILFVMYFVFKFILDLYTSIPKKNKRILSLVTIGFLGSSFTLWDHSIATKVYTLAALLMSLEILFIFGFLRYNKIKYLYVAAFFFGLSLCTHLTSILFAPVLLAFLFLYRDKLKLNKKVVFNFLILATLPLLIYLYIPLSYSQDPFINSGEFNSVKGFYNYITQQDYSFKMANRTSSSFAMAIVEITKVHLFEFTLLGFILAYFGVMFAFEKIRKLFYLSSVLILGNIFLMLMYGNEEDLFVIYRYFLPSYLAMSIFILLGVTYLWEKIRNISNRYQIVLTIILIILPVAPLVAHFHKNNQHNNYIVENYAENVLVTLPANAILFTLGDAISGPLWYLQQVEKEREDVILIEYSLLTRDWYLKNLMKLYPGILPSDIGDVNPAERFEKVIDFNFNKYQIYSIVNNDENNKDNDYVFLSHGLVYEVTKIDKKVTLNDFKELNDGLWSKYNLEGLLDESFYKEVMTREIVEQYNKAHNNIANQYSLLNDDKSSLEELKKALLYMPDSFVTIYNLSSLYREIGDQIKADELLEKAKKINPSYFNGSGGSSQAQNYLSQALEFGQKGDHHKVIELLEQAKLIYPKHESILVNLGIAYASTDQFPQAVAEFESIIEINPSNTTAYLNLASIYLSELNLPEKALPYFQKVIDIEPDHPEKDQIIQAIGMIISTKMEK